MERKRKKKKKKKRCRRILKGRMVGPMRGWLGGVCTTIVITPHTYTPA
jgi:hypothetical protein